MDKLLFLAEFLLVHEVYVGPDYIDLNPIPSGAVQTSQYRIVKAESIDQAKEIAHAYYKRQWESKNWEHWRLFYINITEPLS